MGVANPIGRISSGTAQIYSLGNDVTLTANEQMLSDADSAIAELFHLAAQGAYYSDEELANAVNNSAYATDAYSLMSNGKPLIDPRSNIFDPRYIPDKKDKYDREHSFSKYFMLFNRNTAHQSQDSREELAFSRKVMSKRVITFGLLLILMDATRDTLAKSWREITPLRSTAHDVAKLSQECEQRKRDASLLWKLKR